MESDRVEMSVGSGMVNGDHLSNGIISNGSSSGEKSHILTQTADTPSKATTTPYTNGDLVTIKKGPDGRLQTESGILQDVPPEVLQALSPEFYLPMSKLISRSAQSCWNDLLSLVDRLSGMPVPNQATPNGFAAGNDQSKVNLDKKDLLLNFAKTHKDVFIKLLVLLQWSRKSEEVRKTIELNLWLQQRRQAFNNASGMLGAMLRGLADSQVPNPDLYTASEVLATGTVSSMPKVGYVPCLPLSAKQTIRVLRRLDTILCTRMALISDLPLHLQNYEIHDGRVTFTIRNRFGFDVSVASEDPQAKFGMVDFRFLFLPEPSIPEGLHDEITRIANNALDRDGFNGVCDFMHDLTLSYMLNELTRQARKLAFGLWNGHLRVEMLRRTLVVQYWLKSSMAKSWLEIGIHSGKQQDTSIYGSPIPNLNLRWFREGRLVDSAHIRIDISILSLEDILQQIIAQHTNFLLDAVYDKLIKQPFYDTGELDLTQTASMQDPTECSMSIQLSRMDVLKVTMESISGSLILSPASERVSRVQIDLTRSKNTAEDFVSRISSLRSATADINLNKAVPNSRWLRLQGIKISTADAEKLFGMAVSKISLIRLSEWAPEWLVAITQSSNGDVWWLVQSKQQYRLANARITKIVGDHPLYLTGRPSLTYLERLAYYVTGAIALRCNADYLSTNKFVWTLPKIPAFDGETQLPALVFQRTSMLLASDFTQNSGDAASKGTRKSGENESQVGLRYHNILSASKKVIMRATTTLNADANVLQDLSSARLDPSVVIVPNKRQLVLELESDVGQPIIQALMSKLIHLENIIACAAAVRRSTEHSLQSLSLSSITIRYHRNPDLSLCINFKHETNDASVRFLPVDSNPQRNLSEWVVKSMKRRSETSTRNLSNVFVVLRMTLPILSYLDRIQSGSDVEDGKSSQRSNSLRVHIMQRQPTAYALQYFSTSTNFTRTEISPEISKRLLARFEILAMKQGDRVMWMVRPSIEEFNLYNRPSYTSKTLREKLDEQVFKKNSPSWLRLDGGAACPSEKPEQLLSAIHDAMVDWAKDEIKPETAVEQKPKIANGPVIGTSAEKPTGKPNQRSPRQQQPVSSQQKLSNAQRPNGLSKSQQQTNVQTKAQSFNNKFQAPKPTEVITLD